LAGRSNRALTDLPASISLMQITHGCVKNGLNRASVLASRVKGLLDTGEARMSA